MKFSLDAIAQAIGGTLPGAATGVTGSVVVSGCRTDSREVLHGDLFVPLVVDRDGHEFIDMARERGAVAWLTTRADDRPGAIRVADTGLALRELAVNSRSRMDAWGTAVIGITGSSGKTSTKDLIRAVLACHGPSGASEKSFNNEIGAPLTLLNSPDEAWACVVEMGARGLGHIAKLCDIARPSIGVVTNVGTAHLAMYSGPDEIVQAKGELIASLPRTGTAVLNASDPSMPIHAALTGARVLTFGLAGSSAEVVAENVVLDGELKATFMLRSPWGSSRVELQARGEHQVLNALAAAGATMAAGASLDEVVEGLATDVLSPWRMEISITATGATVINDAYNANDQSMAAALRSLASIAGRRKVAVLGTMAELGDYSAQAHQSIVGLARELGIDTVIGVNEPLYRGADYQADSVQSALQTLAAFDLAEGDVVLVKGSRMAGLESLATALRAHRGNLDTGLEQKEPR